MGCMYTHAYVVVRCWGRLGLNLGLVVRLEARRAGLVGVELGYVAVCVDRGVQVGGGDRHGWMMALRH